ncbi:DUF763 domain-containing protein [Candidatus Dojkabacteria bacterium]|nr:DUF763 domain-containing protein [Candidatus Dojkabacteria bacterium]
MRTGIANLPMHWGKAPRWLFSRMEKLAREITIAIIEEFGSHEMLVRLSDPYWFQAFGCVLGYDWHSSGLTTVTCGALKEGIKGLEKDLNFFVAGGKGRTSRKTPKEIEYWGEKVSISVNPEKLIYASRMSAKVDSTAVQDGYQLYHHNFFFTMNGTWAVVQQGMNIKSRNARRYHWMSEKFTDFVNEPQSAICDDRKLTNVLNLTSPQSTNSRKVISEISKEKPDKILKEYKKITTLSLPRREWIERDDMLPKNLEKVLLSTYETQPEKFEDLLGVYGVGPKSIRALTLIAELAFGTKADWKDPVKYSFAHGGKDGYPYPVDKETYDKSIDLLKKAIKRAKIQRSEKNNALMKLNNF